MSAKGIYLAQAAHGFQALAPVDINSGKTSDVWSMANHAHATISILLGVTGGATTVTVEECDNFTPSNSTAIAFSVYKEETAGGDTLGPLVAATSSGFAASTNDGIFYRIEIDASQLSDGRPNLRVVLSDPSGATFGAIWVELTGPRYAGDQNATVIA